LDSAETRRRLLIGGASAAATLALPSASHAAPRFSVNVASNQGAENATLQQLMADRGFAKALSLDLNVVESAAVNGPMEAMLSGAADVCMISGFVGYLPAIEQGKALRLIGAAMLLPAVAVYAKDPQITRASQLEGRSCGIGPKNGLLHIMMQAYLRKKGVDPAKVNFVPSGSNAQVFEAVAAGKVDAGLSGTAGMAQPAVAHVLEDGRLWKELPEYTYQPAYASLRAIQEKPEAIARCLAAYTRLFRFLSGPNSRTAFLAARRKAAGEASIPEGEAVWRFVQEVHPYATQAGITLARVQYLQDLNVAAGLQQRVLPFDQVADLRPAAGAKRFL
jgi:NitT/TauT family transport system substrate-binding protein